MRLSERAFTMLELLIGVVIVAILAALILTGIRSITERAQGATCAGNMRQVGVALLAYRSDHDGWFPPGKPKHPNVELNFNAILVPDYLTELPICPGARKKLTPTEQKANGSVKVWYQRQGGTYGINAVLTQWKLEAMPWPSPSFGTVTGWYRDARMPLLLEMRQSSVSWSFEHQNMALSGNEAAWGIPPRSHGGKGDSLNFMFVDGHIEMISRNDPSDRDDSLKAWHYPANPNGRFHYMGTGGRYIQHNQISVTDFEKLYPQ